MNKVGVVIQARTGSSRLANKVLLPFYEDQTILSIVADKLIHCGLKVVIATTNNTNDDVIEQFCQSKKLFCFRGAEFDVLNRFISCAKSFGFTSLIRVCSDNPFLDLKEIDKICSTNEYAFIKKKLNTKNLVSLRNPRFCGVSETKRKNVHIVFFLEYRIKLRESMEQISYEYAICGFMEHGQRVYEAYVEHVLTINEEREIPGRQKIVRGSNVPVLASHAGLNPRSKSGYEREAQVINSNFAILRDNYVTDRIYENQGIGSAGLFYVHQLAKQLHCSYIEGIKHPVKVKEDERKDEMDRLAYFYQKNGYKQESGNARIYMKL